MSTLTVLALILGAAPTDARPLRLAVPGLQGVNVSEEALSFYSEHLAQNLRAPGLTVVTQREIAALLGMERQKVLLGCRESAGSCIAELANALGVDAVVLGDVARFDDTFQINAKIVAASDAAILVQASRRVRGQVETLDGVASLGKELGRAFFERKGRQVPAELLANQKPAQSNLRSWAWVPIGVGAAATASGVVLIALARADYTALTTKGEPLSEPDAAALRSGGATKQTAGGTCIAVGLTAVAAGVMMFVLGAPDAPAVSVAPLPGGAAVALSGVFP